MKNHIVPSLTLLVTGAGLGVYAFLGAYGRMFTDDYCYSDSYQTLGLLGTLKGYFFISTFTAHRFSLTLLEWVIDRMGNPGIQWMPLCVLVLWGGGIYLLMREAVRNGIAPISRLETAALSALLLFYSVYLAPNLYQSLYWRTGVLPYTGPLIAGLWLLAYLFLSRRPGSAVRYTILTAGGFLAAGFSEAGAVYVAAGFGLVVLRGLWGVWKGQPAVWQELGRPSLAPIAAILTALVIMYLSPVNIQRQASYRAPAGLVQTLVSAFVFAVDFAWLSIRTQPLPNLVFFLSATAAAFLFLRPGAWNIKELIRAAGVSAAAALFLLWAIHLPSAYVEKAPPAERTLIMARFTILAAGLAAACAFGRWLRSIPRRRWMTPAALTVLILGCLYVVRAAVLTAQNEIPRQQKVAQVWDERDQQLRQAALAGTGVVQVRPIDSLYVGGLLEFYPDPNWVNICAARYYGVEEIQATQSW